MRLSHLYKRVCPSVGRSVGWSVGRSVGNKFQNTSLAAKGALANRLQRRTACKIQNGRQGAPKWQRGSGSFFGRSKQLSLNNFFDLSTPSMRIGRDGGEKRGGN